MTSADHPESFKTRALVMVTGMTPQVVTETVWALAVQQKPAFIPTEIHLISTRGGIDHARNMLLAPGEDALGKLQRDYGLPRIACGEKNLHVITDASGRPLSDIQTPEDNVAAANVIVRLVNDLTSRLTDSALHASIAGGRKTMGFYLGYAMSLFGRAQDRMSHVLVNPPFESNAQFFFPPKTPHVIVLPGNASANTRDARITLAEIPFVRLRHGFHADELRAGLTTYDAAVAAAQRAFAPPSLEITAASRTLVCGGRQVTLQPLLFAFYLWMCELRAKSARLEFRGKDAVDPEPFLRCLRRVRQESLDARVEATAKALAREEGLSRTYAWQQIAKISRILVKALGSAEAAKPYEVVNVGAKGKASYEISIDPGAITIK